MRKLYIWTAAFSQIECSECKTVIERGEKIHVYVDEIDVINTFYHTDCQPKED